MKPKQAIPFKIPKSKEHGLWVQVDEAPYFYTHLHYHPEFQITAIDKGDGIFYAGNSLTSFEEKEVFVIGPNVPHLFNSSDKYHSKQSPGVRGVTLFFDQYSFGNTFFDIKEMINIRSLLQDCSRVIKVSGEWKEPLFRLINSTTEIMHERLIITFLEILSYLDKADKAFLHNEQYNLLLNEHEGSRLNEVLDYTFKHYHQEIKIEQIANIAYLSRSQFSYFFKMHTGKTYIQFLNEWRIENACILLKDRKKNIEQICFEVGFKNVSNFIRQFKKVKQRTPSQYRKLWLSR